MVAQLDEHHIVTLRRYAHHLHSHTVCVKVNQVWLLNGLILLGTGAAMAPPAVVRHSLVLVDQ